MTVLLHTASSRWLLASTKYILYAVAAGLLGYCGFVLIDTWAFQHFAEDDFERMVRTDEGAPADLQSAPSVARGGLIGRMEIPRLGLSVVVIEGTQSSGLRRAAGHIEGTVLPGQSGNAGFAAHRDTFFRPLRNIQSNDVISLTTLRGEFRYRVVSTKIVGPDDVAVLESDGNEILTLVTCYPFYYVGPAPSRFIVRAQRVT